jgi:hypothetical protein
MTVEKIQADKTSVLAIKANQILNMTSIEEFERMVSDQELGKLVREHFSNAKGTQMLLRSDISKYL